MIIFLQIYGLQFQSTMTYFEKGFIDFFTELEENNHKEWFDANRKRYENFVKEPFKAFVGEMIAQISAIDQEVRVEPKDCIFRINRDIRFSKDKTPYKTNVSASIAPGGRKNMSTPGIYIELSARDLRIYSGVYQPDKDQLHRLRSSIENNLEEFQGLINNKNFKKDFGTILGDKNKIIPKEFKEAFEKEELIANKQFYFFKKYDSKQILSPSLVQDFMNDYQTAKPLMIFFNDALED
jgi:uncharacterized protein (TIGR02453 family)